MNKEYKKFVIKSLYGLIEWTVDGLIDNLNYRFRIQFPEEIEFSFKVNQINKLNKEAIDGNHKEIVAIPIVTIILTINDEFFTYTRDFGQEYEIDILHPNYDDEWFYEGEECQSHKDSVKAIKNIEETT